MPKPTHLQPKRFVVAEGFPMTEIRDALGHRSLATTDTYLRGLAQAWSGCASASR